MRIFLIGAFFVAGLVALTVIPTNGIQKVTGISLVSPPRPIDSNKMSEVKRINAGWVAVIPYAFSRSGKPFVSFDNGSQWWGERTEGTYKLIEFARENNLKVMLKPHVWVMGEGWTGDYSLASEADWEKWETDFSKYILNYATVADSMDVEILCIGTEYRIPAKERPDFWRKLIKEIRKEYKGKITYAANWDNHENITWWDAIDYIGIDAYFPLAEGSNPSIEAIKNGWDPLKTSLQEFSKQWKKPILFTEYGFQSVNGGAGKHWEVDTSEDNANSNLQADAYEATFLSLEKEDWFIGGFAWKWHFFERSDRVRTTSWTPQGKPAEKVIAKWYEKMNQ